jgi:hypothetical protein
MLLEVTPIYADTEDVIKYPTETIALTKADFLK